MAFYIAFWITFKKCLCYFKTSCSCQFLCCKSFFWPSVLKISFFFFKREFCLELWLFTVVWKGLCSYETHPWTTSCFLFLSISESQRVFLSCSLDDMLASGSLELTWFGPSGEKLLYVHVMSYHSSISLGNAWSLQTQNISRENDVWFTCSWNNISGKNHTFRNRTGEDLSPELQLSS